MIQTVHPRKIGILGGTFNPVHYGHLLLAEHARDQFALDQILWVPTAHPPHKTTTLLPFADRWEMVQRAIADHPHFSASDLDYHPTTPSYASDTFADLKRQFPHTDWYWIIGLDAFQTLTKWRNVNDMVAHCTWLVAPRPAPRDAVDASTAIAPAVPDVTQIGRAIAATFLSQSIVLRWHRITMPTIALSSSLIRDYCQTGRSLRYLVPESVRLYIHTNNLYQSSPPTAETPHPSAPNLPKSG